MDENALAKPGKSDDQERLVRMSEIAVCTAELAYVTATSVEKRTFFIQQCKYTNNDLVKHNLAIHEHCDMLCGGSKSAPPEHTPKEVKVGDVLCTRFSYDNKWYRAKITSCDPARRECELYFIDYGNYETASYGDLLQVDPKNVPTLERAPFGFHGVMKASENLDAQGLKHLLRCLMDEYLLVRVNERLDVDKWSVELPKVAYNTTFWIGYSAGKVQATDAPSEKAGQQLSGSKIENKP